MLRHDWMFKLVGDDAFQLEDLRCVLRVSLSSTSSPAHTANLSVKLSSMLLCVQVDPASGFNYKYSLFVNGIPLDEFKQRQAKSLRIWQATIHEKSYRIVLGECKICSSLYELTTFLCWLGLICFRCIFFCRKGYIEHFPKRHTTRRRSKSLG